MGAGIPGRTAFKRHRRRRSAKPLSYPVRVQQTGLTKAFGHEPDSVLIAFEEPEHESLSFLPSINRLPSIDRSSLDGLSIDDVLFQIDSRVHVFRVYVSSRLFPVEVFLLDEKGLIGQRLGADLPDELLIPGRCPPRLLQFAPELFDTIQAYEDVRF